MTEQYTPSYNTDAHRDALIAGTLPIRFDQFRAEDFPAAFERELAAAERALSAIKQPQSVRTYDNTLGALDRASTGLEFVMSVLSHLDSVLSSDAIREIHGDLRARATRFFSNIPLDAELWSALKALADSPEGRQLTGARAQFLKKTLDDFRRHGADLVPADKERLLAIEVELAQSTLKFAQNVLDATAAFELVVTDEKQLAGLPARDIAAARASAQAKGKDGWRFTLQAPSYTAVLTYMDDRAIREQLYRAYQRRGAYDPFNNRELINKIIDLRNKKARLLGYATFTALTLSDRMVPSAERALAFIDELERRSRPAFERENRELEAFAQSQDPGLERLEPWDVAYYAEKQRRAELDLDEEQLRPYFPVANVLKGLFELANRVFGVRIKEREGAPVWHPSVRAFDILDTSGEQLATFYTDLHPREQKRDGAWMGDLLIGERERRPHTPHVGYICANITAPGGTLPALLSHREVETVFHEFGHLLHFALSDVEVRSLSGTSVQWDFVELPSQLMENWCWERESLDLFARHYETGAHIPDELYKKLRKSRTFRAAGMMMRQLGFAALDLALHTDFKVDATTDVVGFARDFLQRYSPAPLPSDYAMITGFGHLFSSSTGYAAGYYSYKWAEVLEADVFQRFLQEGILSAKVGREYRDSILRRGGSDEPLNLFRAFMGREPSTEALLRRTGLISEAA